MNKAISSFVIISNCLNSGVDSIDAFIPFVIHLFNIKNYREVSIENICRDFTVEYGLQIPRHPMETILNRMKPQFLYRESSKIIINQHEIRKREESINFDEENKKYQLLIQNFIEFCNNFPTPIDVSYEEAESLFISFLKSHDIDIIFAAYTSEKIESLIPAVKDIEDTDKVYLLNKYVNDLLLKGGVYSEYLIDSAVGHKYASVLLYREYSNVRGKGACANYYLDVGILFDLAGLNNSFRKKAAEDLLALITSKGSKLWIFQHNFDEFMRIIESALYWIENDAVVLSKASRALQYFLNEGFNIPEIKFFISQIDTVLEKNKVHKILRLDPNQNQEYQIDRESLKKTILNIYNSNGLFDLEEREQTLDIDIDSIEYIYKLRKGNTPVNLNSAGHVFLTTNSGLAFASNRYEQINLERGFFTIPTVLTDTFVGTFLWVEEPTQIALEYNRSKMIVYTNAALAPRENLIKKFEIEVNRARLNESNPISNETAYMLLTSDLPRKLLADKTLGDPERINTATPYEVLAETKALLVAEEKRKTEMALQAKEMALKNLDELEKEKDGLKEELSSRRIHEEKIINTISHWGRYIFSFLMVAILVIILWNIDIPKQDNKILSRILSVAFGVLGFIGLSITDIGKKIELQINKKLSSILFIKNKDD